MDICKVTETLSHSLPKFQSLPISTAHTLTHHYAGTGVEPRAGCASWYSSARRSRSARA